MKNKQQLTSDIESLPKFTKRDIYVEKKEDDESAVATLQYIKENRLIGITETDNYKIITTVTKQYELMQFDEVFSPILNRFSDVNGEVKYYWGSSVMVLFPEGNEYKTDDGYSIGLVVSNSVNKVLAININFCILYKDYKIMLPTELSGLRQLHVGKVEEIVKDYESFLSDIRKTWRTIVSKFDRALTQSDIDTVLEKLELGTRYNKEIRKQFEVIGNLKLWDLFIAVVSEISEKSYKKEENKINKLKKVSETLMKYAVIEEI